MRRFQLPPRTVDRSRPVAAAVTAGVLTVSVPKLAGAQVPPPGAEVPVDIAWAADDAASPSSSSAAAAAAGQDLKREASEGRVPLHHQPPAPGRSEPGSTSAPAAAPPLPTATKAPGGGALGEEEGDGAATVVTGAGHPEPLAGHTGVVEERVAAGRPAPAEPDSELPPVTYVYAEGAGGVGAAGAS